MTETSEQKPSKEYLFALIAETEELIREYMCVKVGTVKLTQEECDTWNRRKNFVYSEIKRVRRLI